MVSTRRSSRLQSTPQRGRDTQTPEAVVASVVAATPKPKMPTLGEVDENTESPSPDTFVTPKSSDETTSTAARTPANKRPMKPSGVEMHPEHHHQSTAKPMEEARWLGFLHMPAYTEPVKKGASKIPVTQATPTKSQELASTFSTPEFKFRYRHPSLDLSPEAKKLMEESRQEAQRIRAQMAANPEKFGITKAEDVARKIAKPKGKASRFSDVHMAQFKKMDSIANHASAFRADPNRFKTATTSLKRSPSKAELDNPAASSLKRSPSKVQLDKPENAGGKLPRTKSTMSLHKAEADGASGPAKRVKHNKEDDTSAARPTSLDGEGNKPAAPKSAVFARNTGIPRSRSGLTTPTKASLARAQSVKTMKKTTLIPTMTRSPSVQTLNTPSKTPSVFMEGLRKASQTMSRLPSMKSILRSPIRHYSDDPTKIAAGTHVATPSPNLDKDMPAVPATEPAQKKVNFTDSTLARAQKEKDKAASADSPSMPAPSEVPQEMPSEVAYPDLSAGSPARTTATNANAGGFTFRSDQRIKFGPAIKGSTIRHVRTSDATATLPDPFNASPNKRKLDIPSEITEHEKENEEDEGGRPAKRARPNASPAKEPVSKLSKRKDARRSALSQARLNLLAQPKRRA